MAKMKEIQQGNRLPASHDAARSGSNSRLDRLGRVALVLLSSAALVVLAVLALPHITPPAVAQAPPPQQTLTVAGTPACGSTATHNLQTLRAKITLSPAAADVTVEQQYVVTLANGAEIVPRKWSDISEPTDSSGVIDWSLSIQWTPGTTFTAQFRLRDDTVVTAECSWMLALAPREPTEIRVTPGDGKATVTWSPPTDCGSPVSSYVVRYIRPLHPRPVVNRWASQLDITDVAVSNVLTHTVTDLEDHPITNEHDYEVQVLAESGVGFGPYSKTERFIVKKAKKYTLAPAAAVEGRNAEMTVILGQNAPEGGLVFTVTTDFTGGDNTAEEADVGNVPSTVTVPQGMDTATLSIPIANDDARDNGETFTVSIEPRDAEGWAPTKTGYDSATVTIAYESTRTISFSSDSYQVAEGAGSVKLELSLSAEHCAELSVPVTLAAGTATGGGVDFASTGQDVGIEKDAVSAEFGVTITDDDVDEDAETLTATLTVPPGYAAGNHVTATVTITDDDTARVTVRPTTLSVDEGGSKTYDVVLGSKPSANVTVDAASEDEGAVTVTPASRTFTPDNWNTPKGFTVSGVEEDDDFDDESVSIDHTVTSADSKYSGITASSVTVGVSDNDESPKAVTVAFAQSSYTVSEGSSVAVKVKLSVAPERSVTIPITKSNQGGASSSDYSGVPASVTFGATDIEKTISFSATQDSADDDGESVDLGFGTLPTGVSAGSTDETTVSITDDDVPSVTVAFGSATYSVNESDDPATTDVNESQATVTVTLSADPERTVTIPITKTNQGGATSADYSGVPGSVVFHSGDTSKTFTFSATADTIDDDGESVDLGFGTLPTGVTAGTTSTASVSITDDDATVLTITPNQTTRVYGGTEDLGFSVGGLVDGDTAAQVVSGDKLSRTAGNDAGSYTLGLSGLSIKSAFSDKYALPTAPASTTYTITKKGISAISGATVDSRDWDGTTAATFDTSGATGTGVLTGELDDFRGGGLVVTGSFPAGARTAAGTHTLSVGYSLQDNGSFKAGNYSLSMSAQSGSLSGTLNAVVPGAPQSVAAAAGPQKLTATWTAPASNGGSAITRYRVRWRTAQVGEQGDQDYAAAGSWQDEDGDDNAGEDVGKVLTYAIASLINGRTYDVQAAAVNSVGTGPFAPATPAQGTPNVPAVSVAFEQSSYTVSEGSSVTVKVKLSVAPERSVTIPITKTNQGGASSSDYSGVPASVTFGATDTEKTISFTATVDNVDDDGESVDLGFGTLPTGVSAGTTSTSSVSITDDDVPSVSVNYESASYSVDESDDTTTTDVNESQTTVTMTLSADPERTVTIPITKTNQGGATSADYSGVPSSVVFNSGDTSRTFTFSAAADTIDDDGESVKLTFGTLPTGVSEGTTKETVVSITDDDVPSVSVNYGSASYSVDESDDPATMDVNESQTTVTMTLSADPERTVTIPITKTNQGGATSADYSGVPSSVVFHSGDTSRTFTFSAAADTIDDDGESVDLSFGTLPTGVAAGATSTASVSINDDDVPSVTVAFGSATYSVDETDDPATTDVNESQATVTVTLSADPERTVTIPITKTNQGGATSADYTGVPGSVFFNSGDTSKTFTFSATADTINDDGESVKLAFGTLPTGVSAGVRDEATVTINDDDVPAVTAAFEQSAFTVAEGSNVMVKVTLGADPERTVTIPITKRNQGGASPSDYSGVPADVVFDSGDTSKTFTFSATADTIYDDGESVKLSLGTLPTGISAGSPSSVQITIRDDEATAPVAVTGLRVEPSYGSLILSWTAPVGDVTGYEVHYTLSRTVAADADVIQEHYGLYPDTEWVLDPRHSGALGTRPTQTINNLEPEFHRVRVRALNDHGRGPWVEGSGTPMPRKITVSLSASPNPLVEGGDVTVTATLKIGDLPTILQYDFFIPLKVTRIDSEEGDHGTTYGVTIRKLQRSASVVIPTHRDGDGDDEFFTVAVGRLTEPVRAHDTEGSVRVRIAEREPPLVSLEASPNPVHEGNTVNVRLRLSQAMSSDLTVPVTVTGIDSEHGDHGSLGSITVPRGQTGGMGTITTSVDDDRDDERFRVSLGSVPLPAAAGSPTSVEVTIADQTEEPEPGPPTDTFGLLSVSPSPAQEGATVTLTATLENPAPSGGIVVRFLTYGQGGSPASADDYTLSPATGQSSAVFQDRTPEIRIPAGQRTATATLSITEDGTDEGDETLGVQLAVSFSDRQVGYNLTLIIQDPQQPDETSGSSGDEGAAAQPTAVTLALDAASVSESAGPATLTATLDAPAPEGGIGGFLFAGADGTASQGVDFTVPLAIFVPGGQRSATASISITGDDLDEADETVALSAMFDIGTALLEDTITLTITDDDTAGVTVSAASPLAVNEGGTATYTVVLDSQPIADVTVIPYNADTNAVAVSPVSHTFTLSDWHTPLTFAVTGLADDDTNDESVEIIHWITSDDWKYAVVPVDPVAVSVSDTTPEQQQGPPNQPPTVASAIGDATIVSESGTHAASLSGVFEDPDGDALTVSAASSNDGVAAVSVSADHSSLTVRGKGSGTATIMVTAADGRGGTVENAFTVTVKGAPLVASAISDESGLSVGDNRDVTLSGVFTDGDGDALTFTAASGDEAIATATMSADQSKLTLTGVSEGTATVLVTAEDSDGNRVSDAFAVEVVARRQPATPNQTPTVSAAIADVTIVNESGTKQVSLSGVFSDGDNDSLTVTAASLDETVATVSVSAGHSSLMVSAQARGTAVITVTANDGNGGTVSDAFTVTVKAAPVVASAIADMDMKAGATEAEKGAQDVSLAGVFSDADGDTLTFSADTSDYEVAEVFLFQGTLTVAGLADGSATITVMAEDSDGNTVSDAFDVKVVGPPTPVSNLSCVAQTDWVLFQWDAPEWSGAELYAYDYDLTRPDGRRGQARLQGYPVVRERGEYQAGQEASIGVKAVYELADGSVVHSEAVTLNCTVVE